MPTARPATHPAALVYNNQLDTLPYYATIAPLLTTYLKNKPLATKIWLPTGFFFLKRGSKEQPLSIDELPQAVTTDFLNLRIHKLEEVKAKLTQQQIKVWNYFPPRKLLDLFYATNGESPGKKMERIFFDVDRKGIPTEKALLVTAALSECITQDKEFQGKYPGKIFPMWTGNSFHLTIILRKPLTPTLYARDIAFSKDDPQASFTGRWASVIGKETGFKVTGGHEKKKAHITIDPSQTPSGKLARAPFSLHMKSAREVDGVALPLTREDLFKPGLLKTLVAVTPDTVMRQPSSYSKKLS